MLWDYNHKHAKRWIEGKLIDADSIYTVFVFAASWSAFSDVSESIRNNPDLGYIDSIVWVSGEENWRLLEKARQPQLRFAVDWMEASEIYDHRFKLLMEVGHL